jgi:hypothetical protein
VKKYKKRLSETKDKHFASKIFKRMKRMERKLGETEAELSELSRAGKSNRGGGGELWGTVVDSRRESMGITFTGGEKLPKISKAEKKKLKAGVDGMEEDEEVSVEALVAEVEKEAAETRKGILDVMMRAREETHVARAAAAAVTQLNGSGRKALNEFLETRPVLEGAIRKLRDLRGAFRTEMWLRELSEEEVGEVVAMAEWALGRSVLKEGGAPEDGSVVLRRNGGFKWERARYAIDASQEYPLLSMCFNVSDVFGLRKREAAEGVAAKEEGAAGKKGKTGKKSRKKLDGIDSVADAGAGDGIFDGLYDEEGDRHVVSSADSNGGKRDTQQIEACV